MTLRPAAFLMLLAGFGLHSPAASGQARQPDPERGREIAQKHCARCHVIGNFNKFGGLSSTPSFQLLVNAFKDYEERLLTFYARRPHPVFIRIRNFRTPYPLPPSAKPIELELEALEDILAYAKTLKKK